MMVSSVGHYLASVSQSTLGNEGSNACSIIPTLLGYRFLMLFVLLLFTWINTICECIFTSNMVYNIYHDAVLHRYLSIEEAIEILSRVITVQVNMLLPVRYMDEHKPSTVEEQLAFLTMTNIHHFWVASNSCYPMQTIKTM